MQRMFSFAVVFCVVLFAGAVYAHPPQDIKISYDAKSRLLTAVIDHVVSNPLNHYISKVDVAVNGKEVVEHQISRQDNGQTQTVVYLIPDAKAGDMVSVEGYCSISGKLAKDIKIAE